MLILPSMVFYIKTTRVGVKMTLGRHPNGTFDLPSIHFLINPGPSLCFPAFFGIDAAEKLGGR